MDKIKKPCHTCPHYCGKDKNTGDLCNVNGDCTLYTDWFKNNGWQDTVEPFRRLNK